LKQSHLAKKYARAFVQRVVEKDDPAAIVGQLGGFSELVYKNKALRDFFNSPLFSTDEKKGFFDVVVEKAGLGQDIAKVVGMLIEQSKFHLIRDVVTYSGQILAERLKKARATVFSAVEISSADLERLGAALKKIIGRDPEMKAVVDPALLGGVRVKVGSMVYDGSIKGQLEILKEELIKG